MATVDTTLQNEQADARKALWLERLSSLISMIEKWAIESDWSTRWIDKRMDDSETGDYLAPVLLMQKETAKLMLEPVSMDSMGADGVVDLYLMPAYDDIARLFYTDNQWKLLYVFSGEAKANWDRVPEVLTQDLFLRVIEEMVKNAR